MPLAGDRQEDERREGDGGAHLAGDPMEVALLELGRRALGDVRGSQRLAEVPFDAGRKRLTTVHRRADGGAAVLYTKGAPEAVLPLCTTVAGDDGAGPFTDEWRRRVVAVSADDEGVVDLRTEPEPNPDEPYG